MAKLPASRSLDPEDLRILVAFLTFATVAAIVWPPI